MEYKVTVTSNEGKRRTLNENSGYGMIPISRGTSGNYWQISTREKLSLLVFL